MIRHLTERPTFEAAKDAAREIVPVRHPRDRRGLVVDQQAVEATAGRAVMAALAEHGDKAGIVVVNVNIQVAYGGGATNQIGGQPSANNSWGRDR